MMHNARPEYALPHGDSQAEDDREVQKRQQTAVTIYDVTDSCFDVFERLVSAADGDASLNQAFLVLDSQSPDESPRDMRGFRNNFAFWIDYTGALAPTRASLDARLHGHDEIKEMVMELLEMIQRNLLRCKLFSPGPGLQMTANWHLCFPSGTM